MKNNNRISKGAPSGFVISLLVHAAAFLLAGMLVVFTVVNKEEKKFTPPKPVDRPKMKLKKPKVKVKKSAKPKSTSRIVTKVKRANMPDIQLPEMSGMGDSLAGGIGGFDIAPNLKEVTLLGNTQSVGNDFVGTFYDLKRTRSGNVRPVSTAIAISDPLRNFVRSGWRPSSLAKYYKSPNKLYATSFMVPTTLAELGAEVFGERETLGWGWAVHYKGKICHKDGIKFRFWGHGDSVLIVRLDGKIVLDACYNRTAANDGYGLSDVTSWQSTSSDHEKWHMGHHYSSIGDWITLEPGEQVDMEVLLGDVKGYGISFMLVVEEDGVEYERNWEGAPILPMFKTADPSRAYLDQIHTRLISSQATTTNGPIFNDYQSEGKVIDLSPQPIITDTTPEPQKDEPTMRVWTSESGKTFEAKFVTTMGDKIVFKSPKGKQIKLLHSQLSAQDLEYIELANKPAFNVSFFKKSKQRQLVRSPLTLNWGEPPIVTVWTFGAKLKQTSSGPYNHELKVEYFAIGAQAQDDRKFVLLDRGESTFIPTKENDRSHKFNGDPTEVTFVPGWYNRGEEYDGNLVVVTDKNGDIVAHTASSEWLLDHLEALRVLPINAFFDKEGRRVLPTGGKSRYR